jgi:uncharacterized integral membrane protein
MPKHVPRGMKKYVDVERNKCRLLLLLLLLTVAVRNVKYAVVKFINITTHH